MSSPLPILYYPTKVLFIDDDKNLLDLYNDKYKTYYNVNTLSNPIDALQILENQPPLNLGVIDKNIDKSEIELSDNEGELIIIKLILNNMLPFINSQYKYKQIGIVIADYQMPEMNGIDLFKKITDKTIKKILLTGEYNLSGAVESLNNKVIDCYINKGEADTMQNITTFIEAFQLEYFNDLTSELIGDLIYEYLPFLVNNNFITFFRNKVKEYKIREYYLLDKNGSFLMIDDQNQKFVFVRHTNDSLDEFCNLYNFNEPDLLDPIIKRNMIPFFSINVDPLTIASFEWKNHIHAANLESDFYWAFIKVNSDSLI
ncbi:MAG: hypothetical protein ACK52I_36520 [Pseudomonadota bacterium]